VAVASAGLNANHLHLAPGARFTNDLRTNLWHILW